MTWIAIALSGSSAIAVVAIGLAVTGLRVRLDELEDRLAELELERRRS